MSFVSKTRARLSPPLFHIRSGLAIGYLTLATCAALYAAACATAPTERGSDACDRGVSVPSASRTSCGGTVAGDKSVPRARVGFLESVVPSWSDCTQLQVGGAVVCSNNSRRPPIVLFTENFETSNVSSRGWYDTQGATLSSAEHISGSTNSAQFRFPVGATTPAGTAGMRHKFTPTNSVYLSYYVKYTPNWVGSGQAYHPHEFYILSNMDDDYVGPSHTWLTLYVEQNYQNGGRPVLSIQDNKSINTALGALPSNLVGQTENRSVGGCNGIAEPDLFPDCFPTPGNTPPWYNGKIYKGPVTFQPNPGPGYKADWNFVEVYFQLNTIVNGIGQSDGVMQYWFNGSLILDRHNVQFRTGAKPNVQFNQLLIAPYIGSGSSVDQSFFIDNLTVATGRVP